jgi:hypothetical protein
MMAWLHDNGDENEFSQFEEDEGGEKDEGVLEETEEEVTITERPGVPEAPPSIPKPKPRRPSAARRRKPPRAKARPKKKAAARRSKKSSARKKSRSRKKR